MVMFSGLVMQLAVVLMGVAMLVRAFLHRHEEDRERRDRLFVSSLLWGICLLLAGLLAPGMMGWWS